MAWFVTDLCSTQGTTLGGERLRPHKPVILRDHDRLKISRYTFIVTVGEGGQPEGAERGPVTSRYATRPSIFLRLGADQTALRELSWSEFHERYAPVVVGFARNLGLALQDADDVLQEGMLAFFRVSPRFEYDPSKGRFRGYLKRITRQVVAAQLRRAGRAGIATDDLDAEDSPAVEEIWERQWSEQLFLRAGDEARGTFEARTMEAFDLFARRGVPAEEVAARLGMSINSVHHAKSRVMKVVGEIVERIRAEEG